MIEVFGIECKIGVYGRFSIFSESICKKMKNSGTRKTKVYQISGPRTTE